MKKLIKCLTRPKVTIFLKSGNVVREREFPWLETNDSITENISDESRLGKEYDCVSINKRIEHISIRKWYQPWP